MTKDDDQVSDWTKGLPTSEELTPLSHTLISRILASAFRIKHEEPMTEEDVRRESQATIHNLFKQKPIPSFDAFPAFQEHDDAGGYGYGVEGRSSGEEFRGNRRVEEEFRENRGDEEFRKEFRGNRRTEERRDGRSLAIEDRMDYRGSAFGSEIPKQTRASGSDTTTPPKGSMKSNTGAGGSVGQGLQGSVSITATNTGREHSSTPVGNTRPARYGHGADTANTHERPIQPSLPYIMNSLPYGPYERVPESSYGGPREDESSRGGGSTDFGRKMADFELEDANSAGGLMNSNDEPLKRARLVWTPQLHKRFVEAVGHLGIKNAVPKTIMQLMNVEGLTRENVASHLQKYRLYLKRMQGLSNDGPSASDHLFASMPLPPGIMAPGMNPHFMGSSSSQRDDGGSAFATPIMPMPFQGLVRPGPLGGYEYMPYGPMGGGFMQRAPMPDPREAATENESRSHASNNRSNKSQSQSQSHQSLPSSSYQHALPLFPTN